MLSHARPVRRPIIQLGWAHYWLLVATLGGMLSLVAMVLIAIYL